MVSHTPAGQSGGDPCPDSASDCISSLLSSAPPLISYAGSNPNAKLALHLVASEEYLDCPELTPASCDSINLDLSIEEILAAGGYGYILLVAYDIDSITGLEFAVAGWPTGRGAPVLTGPTWCTGGLTLGNHLDGGGITAFGQCLEPESNGVTALAYWTFGPLDSTDLPIDLIVTPSAYSDDDSLLIVLDCSVDYASDDVLLATGCSIGGTYGGDQVDCAGESPEGGEGGDSGQQEDAGLEENAVGGTVAPLAVEIMGPHVQRAWPSGAWVSLKGQGVVASTEVRLVSTSDGTRVARAVFLGDGVFAYRAATTEADTGMWSVVVSNSDEETVVLEDALHLVRSLIGYRAGQCGSNYHPGVVSVKLRPGVLSLPKDSEAASPAEATIESDALNAALEAHSMTMIERIFQNRTSGQCRGTDINGNPTSLEDVSQFYQLWLTGDRGALDLASDLEGLPEVRQVWLTRPVSMFADSREPDDPRYVSEEQWAPQHIGCPEAWAVDTCSAGVRISIVDEGLYYTHEDLGASEDAFDFPNSRVVGGYDFWADPDDGYPYQVGDAYHRHGTRVAGVAAATTNNGLGMAGVGWNARLLGYRCYPESVAQFARAVARSVEDSALVVNMSWGYHGCVYPGNTASDFAELRNAIHGANQAGLTLIAAGGNEYGRPPPCPALWPGVIGVCKVNQLDRWTSGTVGSHIDIGAPSSVLTTDDDSTDAYMTSFGGTSASAPHVAGAAAILQSAAQAEFGAYFYGEDICGLFCASSDTAWSPAGQIYPNDYVGWGRLNIPKALARLEAPYNDGEGPTLLHEGGVDTFFVDGDSIQLENESTLYWRYRCEKWAPFWGSYSDSFAWGMHRFQTNGAPPQPGDEDEMYWPFCEVCPFSVSATGCSLYSYVYLKIVDTDTTAADTSWVPCPPDSLRWSYRVSGIFESTTDAMGDPSEAEVSMRFVRSYPNPFNPATTIQLHVPRSSHVTLQIYDVSGRLVTTLVDGQLSAGQHAVVWDGNDASGAGLASGVYFARVSACGERQTLKVVLLR